ncbi:COBRA-like isoform X1, partial [Olea europaea subsp. europaea]
MDVLIAKENSEAYDMLDPNGILSAGLRTARTRAFVTIFKFQKYRHIQAPGWSLGWTWAEEVIWIMKGGQTLEQGDCLRFKGNGIPRSCKKDPIFVNLLPGTPYNQQIANYCKGGVINSWMQDPINAASPWFCWNHQQKRYSIRLCDMEQISAQTHSFWPKKSPTCCGLGRPSTMIRLFNAQLVHVKVTSLS